MAKISVFFLEFLHDYPGHRIFFAYGLIVFLYTFLLAHFSAFLKLRRKIKTAYTRKLFHLGIFTAAACIQIYLGLLYVIAFGMIVSAFVLYAVYKGDSDSIYEALARESDYPHRSFFIVIPLITTAVGGLLSNLLFGNLAYVGYLVGGWGDAVGEPVGARWGKHRYSVPSVFGMSSERSLEGSFAVFIVSSLSAMLALSVSLNSSINIVYIGLACGLAAALVEAVSTHGFDNLSIQLVATVVAYVFVN